MAPVLMLLGGGLVLGGWLASKGPLPPIPGHSAGHGTESGGVLSMPEGTRFAVHPSGTFRIAVSPGAPGALDRLWLLPKAPLDVPDLLVYGVETTGAADLEGGPLPEGVVLLGSASGSAPTSWQPEALPAAVLLFSLAHQNVAAALEVPR